MAALTVGRSLCVKLAVDCNVISWNKRKVLSVDGKVTVTRQIENGNKGAGICRAFGLGNSGIQKIWEIKTQPKLLVRLNRTDRE